MRNTHTFIKKRSFKLFMLAKVEPNASQHNTLK